MISIETVCEQPVLKWANLPDKDERFPAFPDESTRLCKQMFQAPYSWWWWSYPGVSRHAYSFYARTTSPFSENSILPPPPHVIVELMMRHTVKF